MVFAPIVIQNFDGRCPIALPNWVERVRNDPNAAPLIKSYADALERYRSGEIKYVKLLDGGLVDNYGLAGFTIARLASDTPFGPLAPQEAVKLRRFLFLVVDSGRAPSGNWAQTIPGPSGVDLIMATSDTATDSGAIGSYSAFDDTMTDWKNTLVRWRCGLSEADRRRFGAPPGWNCRDVQFFIGRISFDELGPAREAALNAVETRLKLPPDQVDLLIAAGRDALNDNPKFRAFLNSLSRTRAGAAAHHAGGADDVNRTRRRQSDFISGPAKRGGGGPPEGWWRGRRNGASVSSKETVAVRAPSTILRATRFGWSPFPAFAGQDEDYSAAALLCPSRRLSVASSFSAASAITVPGGKIASAPADLSAS